MIKLIVGLRNPGAAYTHTRHNAGGWFAETLVNKHGSAFKLEKKFQSELVDIKYEQSACKVMLPTTFMNHSGIPISTVCQFYRIKPDEILIAHDELDLPAGRIKLKTGGGHGGHNGLRDTIQQLGSADFHRLRIGIGHPGHKDLVTDYVLGKPTATERELELSAIDKALSIMPILFSDGLSAAMNAINTEK